MIMRYEAKNVLITGGAGFIGSNLVRYLLTQLPTLNIINVDKLSYAGSLDNLQNLPNAHRHQFIKADITNSKRIKRILQTYEVDTIIHLAAESHVDRSIHMPQLFVQSNIVGTFTLLQEATTYWQSSHYHRNSCLFYYISTDEVHGELSLQAPAFTEESAILPRSPYSASKASAENLVKAFYHTYETPIVISRCSNNYGPFQHPEKLIPTIIKSCFNWQPIPIYGEGKNVRDWLHVQDHCVGISKVLENGRHGEVYHFGGQNEQTNIAVVTKICDIMDRLYPCAKSYHSLITSVPDRMGHDFRYAMNIKKVQEELLWQPTMDWEQGLEQTIRFYDHP